MKDKLNYYKHYENLIKSGLDTSIVETFEYQRLSERYPHIAESIELKRKLKQLSNELKSQKHHGLKFKIKQEIRLTKSQLKKNSLFKRIHGERKQERAFHKKFKHKASKIRYALIAKKTQKKICQPIALFRMKIRLSMHKNLPPTLFNLGEHDVFEKGLVLREWLKEKRDELDKVLQ